MSVLNKSGVLELVELAVREDLGSGDVTSGLLDDPSTQAAFRLVARQLGVLAGCEVVPAILQAYPGPIEIDWVDAGKDSAQIKDVPTVLATLRGPLGALLSAERVVLNFLQRLCGIATATREFVRRVEGTNAAIYDTRKTIPGWRALDKYAVRCGGGLNHRDGLYDAVLIKDNHLYGVGTDRLAATVFDMLSSLNPEKDKPKFIEVEADSVAQVAELLKVVGIDVILLDNFSVDELRAAVALRGELGLEGKVELEASGGITLETVEAVARTGVDRISVGALTHSAPALDLAMDRV